MKLLFLIPFYLLLTATTGKPDTKLIFSDAFSDTSKIPVQKRFTSCFKNIDTTKTGYAVSCSWGTYKLINNKYILRIATQLYPPKINWCYDITINKLNLKPLVELLVYDKNNATLSNICTDMGDLNNPHPSRRFQSTTGQVIIGFTAAKNSYDDLDISVLLRDIFFTDSTTGERIEFKNELIWKVLYDGIPG